MAHAKLHMICGNCGCNDMFEFKVDKQGRDYGDYFLEEVYIGCKNCSTSHALSDNAKSEEDNDV